MMREEIEEFVADATFDTTMYFEEIGERDAFVKRIAERWEQDVQNAVDEAFTRGQHSMHPF